MFEQAVRHKLMAIVNIMHRRFCREHTTVFLRVI
jgi:hypothetical protein